MSTVSKFSNSYSDPRLLNSCRFLIFTSSSGHRMFRNNCNSSFEMFNWKHKAFRCKNHRFLVYIWCGIPCVFGGGVKLKESYATSPRVFIYIKRNHLRCNTTRRRDAVILFYHYHTDKDDAHLEIGDSKRKNRSSRRSIFQT